LLRQAAASSPSWDWGTEWYQRRASSFLGGIRAQLRTLHPRLPSHARLYFARIPNDIGMLAGDGPALRVWYGDSTLVAHYYSAYRTRRAGETPGPDYFFRFDTTRGLVPVLEGREPSPDLELEPDWTRDHEVLAALLLNAGDLERSLAEYRKLAAAHPDDAPYALYCGALLEALGRKAEAVPYFDRAGRTFGGRDAARATATRLLGDLRAPPP
jgi:tetratricopeptide (TPR) repeat protein